jgi:hypothetical protein
MTQNATQGYQGHKQAKRRRYENQRDQKPKDASYHQNAIVQFMAVVGVRDIKESPNVRNSKSLRRKFVRVMLVVGL